MLVLTTTPFLLDFDDLVLLLLIKEDVDAARVRAFNAATFIIIYFLCDAFENSEDDSCVKVLSESPARKKKQKRCLGCYLGLQYVQCSR